MSGHLWSTGDIARQAGTTLRTVRHYEDVGLLEPQERSKGGHRLYDASGLQRLRLIGRLREAGLGLEEIRCLLEVRRLHDAPAEATGRARIAVALLIEELHRKMESLRDLRRELVLMSESLRECEVCKDGSDPCVCRGCDVVKGEHVPEVFKTLWLHPSPSKSLPKDSLVLSQQGKVGNHEEGPSF